MINPGTLTCPFYIYIGATFNPTVTWNDNILGGAVDLTGFTADMKIRAYVGNPLVIADLSTSNGGISIPFPTTGVLNLLLTPTQTALLSPTPVGNNAVFDIKLFNPSGVISYLLEGEIIIQQMVTR